MSWLLPLVILAVSAHALAEPINLALAKPEVLADRLNAGNVPAKLRQQTIRKLFEDLGCAVTEVPVTKKAADIVCTLPGTGSDEIIVGGHYDFIARGAGIIDDWSGTAMLVSLFETLRTSPRTHTFRFVAFAEEETGLNGSKAYVKHLTSDERAQIQAFVNLECLGLSAPKVWVSRSDPKLVTYLFNIGKAAAVEVQGMNVDKVGDDDTHPFLDKKIPVVSIHSVTPESFRLLHSPRDQTEAIHMDWYASAYKLAAFYLAYLDQKL